MSLSARTLAVMRVATWNTWWCFGPWERRQPLVAAALARTGADVILLQETWPAQAEAMAAACDLAVIEVAAEPFDRPVIDAVPPDHVFGNAILARPSHTKTLGVLSVASAPDDAAPRFAVAARHRAVESDGSDGGEVVVISTHLCHLFDHGPVRATQLDTIRAWADELADGAPVILGGDLNLVPNSDEYAAAIAPAWDDLWLRSRPGEPGATMVPDNPRITFTDWMADRNEPGAAPGVRLDYLLARPGDGVDVCPERVERFGSMLDGWPSDHLGLVAEVMIEPA